MTAVAFPIYHEQGGMRFPQGVKVALVGGRVQQLQRNRERRGQETGPISPGLIHRNANSRRLFFECCQHLAPLRATPSRIAHTRIDRRAAGEFGAGPPAVELILWDVHSGVPSMGDVDAPGFGPRPGPRRLTVRLMPP